ncbi:hypothetical protein Y032_0084g1710 [Ancylostoma ceylanicum]|uniref:Uncharacterized protein n=1 Tax=Ancylostoma ceylanicum TaxID=53326 RepID=A0A016TQI7_9BILA|nr:hypothetical protein Y032_0084g1710 [Ancylostoma ceylanicum]
MVRKGGRLERLHKRTLYEWRNAHRRPRHHHHRCDPRCYDVATKSKSSIPDTSVAAMKETVACVLNTFSHKWTLLFVHDLDDQLDFFGRNPEEIAPVRFAVLCCVWFSRVHSRISRSLPRLL